MIYELHHCSKRYLFKDKPLNCPACSKQLKSNIFRTFELDDYLTKSRSTKNSLIIRPTNGFFKDYKTKQDLHIGLTDKFGNLIEFNENGLTFGIDEWLECFKLASIDSLIEDYLIKSSATLRTTRTDKLSTDNLLVDNSLVDSSLIDKSLTNRLIDKQKITKDCSRTDKIDKSIMKYKSGSSLKDSEIDSSSSNLAISSINDKSAKNELNLIVEYWNYTIEICKRDELINEKFSSNTYDEFENNCLDFVIFFFKLLNLDQFKRIKNKIEFCELIIKPRISELFKLIEFDRCKSSKYLVL